MLTAASALADIRTVQKCLSVIYIYLQLTAHDYAPQPEVKETTTADYIIVGGGSSGCVIANRLSEDPKVTVALLEAGGDPPIESEFPGEVLYLKDSHCDWNFTAQNIDYNFFKKDISIIPQGRVVGGSSSIDILNYIRGASADYDAWADKLGDDSWKYTNLLQFFKKSEHFCNIDNLSEENKKYHGTKGYMGVTKLKYDDETNVYIKAIKEYGINYTEDVNGEHGLGYTQPMVRIAHGKRQSTAYAFLSEEFKCRSNLITYKYTTVTKILFDKNNVAIGVEAVNNGKKLTFKANKEVIIAAGVFNSAKLLMLSGIGPKKHLSDNEINCISDLPVGVGLQDHTSVLITFNMGNLKYPKGPSNPHEFPTPMVYGSVALDPKAKTPDYVSYNYLANSEKFLQYCSFSLGYTNEVCDNIHEKAKTGGEILFGIVSHVHAKSRGSVTLNSNDPFDKPLITLGRFTEKEDLEKFVKYIEHYVGITKTNTFKDTGGSIVYLDLPDCDAEQGSTEYWRYYASSMATTFQSFAGTCAMGSVVDSNLLVIGVKGLRVADSSIIPIITSGTMNVPSIMIGEKCAHIITGGKGHDDNDSHSDEDHDHDSQEKDPKDSHEKDPKDSHEKDPKDSHEKDPNKSHEKP